MSWIDIGPVADIPLRGARKIKTALGCVAVFRTGPDEVFAATDVCPHKGGPLSEGIVHGQSVTCPLHNWVIDLQSGQARGADAGCVKTYPAKVSDGRVMVKLAL